MADPTGESGDTALERDFDRRVRVRFGGPVITSDAGRVTYHELDGAVGLTDMGVTCLSVHEPGRTVGARWLDCCVSQHSDGAWGGRT